MTDMPPAEGAGQLDPAIRRFRDALNTGYQQYGNFQGFDLGRRRRIAEQVREPWTRGGPQMHAVRELAVGDPAVPIRVYHPEAGEGRPALLYIHGGGWTMFSLDTHDRLMREYAARAGVAVVGVDYSLSPEARYPVAIGEIVAVVEWLREHGASLGIDGSRLAVGGDSAGANLSVASCLRMKSLGWPACRGMLLNYGVYDLLPTDSYARYDGPDYMLTSEEMAGFWRNYLGDDIDSPDSLACPLRAELAGLPPAFMAIAECDVLLSENREMARRLEAAGVPVETRLYRGVTHSFLEAMSIAEVSRRALEEAAVWLRRLLLEAAPA